MLLFEPSVLFTSESTKSKILGRLQPSKTTTQKTPNALGVEESSSPRRALRFCSSNSSRGRMRAECVTCVVRSLELSVLPVLPVPPVLPVLPVLLVLRVLPVLLVLRVLVVLGPVQF